MLSNKPAKDAEFFLKLQLCSQDLDFNDESLLIEEKAQRLKLLSELKEIIGSSSGLITLVLLNFEALMNMIKQNIFRPLPIVKKESLTGDPDIIDEEVIISPSWSHLLPVYEFFLQLINKETVEVNTLCAFINHKFMQQFLELFDSEEPHEREYLKNILHSLYAKLVQRRKMIRKTIIDIFHVLIHETHKFNGTCELFDVLAGVVSGYRISLARRAHSFIP